MGKVALTQEPFEVAIGCHSDVVGLQRRLLLSVAARLGLMALLAMIAIEDPPGSDCVGRAREGVGTGMVLGGNAIPARVCGGEDNGGDQEQ